ncbi:etoposide-induced protein 2.4 homolog isoform X2 [Phymastichus coffea]|uniref:etoposide-induced protein 2.4 homolog isoform X2 n=1 Tax=Phymastichus coffea TaxID=108790 RepID=UPI00273CE6FB|nr:etoposide-induced protein 2.4 homolog isoform X2 [Phymastichus coffea]
MKITGIIIAVWRGLIDSLRGALVLFSMDKQFNERIKKSASKVDSRRKENTVGQSPAKFSKQHRESKVLQRTVQCCALNGGVCLASILIFEYGLLPSLKYLLNIIFGQSPGMGTFVWSWMKPFLSLIFSTVWILPVFLLSKIINMLWFQDIADSAYRCRQGRPVLLSSISKLLADMAFSTLVQGLFLGQSNLVSKVPLPPIGDILELLHLCLLNALYSFEYKWYNMGWELHRRLEFIEFNWPYFVGFGLPLALSSKLSDSYVIRSCVFAILFPLFIVSGNEAEPVIAVCDCHFKIFSPVVAISNALFSKTIAPNKRR